jgi:hypothetical protein
MNQINQEKLIDLMEVAEKRLREEKSKSSPDLKMISSCKQTLAMVKKEIKAEEKHYQKITKWVAEAFK